MEEISTKCYVDIPKIVRNTVREIGYDRAKYGFDAIPAPSSPPSTSSRTTLPWGGQGL
jgi:S-adenosylmethionine synthetase